MKKNRDRNLVYFSTQENLGGRSEFSSKKVSTVLSTKRWVFPLDLLPDYSDLSQLTVCRCVRSSVQINVLESMSRTHLKTSSS